MLFVFTTAPSSRPEKDAIAVAEALRLTAYEIRLALAPGPPAVVLTTEDASQAATLGAFMRARGYEVQTFDDVNLISSVDMIEFGTFTFEPEGVRRAQDNELLGFGDVFAVLRAVHELSSEVKDDQRRRRQPTPFTDVPVATVNRERENVAYFFRRSGGRPWILREKHTNYGGLGAEREPAAYGNFLTTLRIFRQNAPMAIADDRLLRRRVAQRLLSPETSTEGARHTTRQGIDLLAHLLAVTIASQGGSPYR